MKFALISVLVAICAVCITAQHITTWGDVHNTRILGQERVIVASAIFRVQNRTVTYRSNGPIIVRGIMHVDHKTQSRVTPTISQGGIGFNFASVNILSQRGHGINSTVRFFG